MKKGLLEIEYDEREFTSFAHWINKGKSWLSRDDSLKYVCVDSVGDICRSGADFKNATYPVRFGLIMCAVKNPETCFAENKSKEVESLRRIARLAAIIQGGACCEEHYKHSEQLLIDEMLLWKDDSLTEMKK